MKWGGKLDVQIDSREKAHAIEKILNEFSKQEIKYFVSKLYVGDYTSLDNSRLAIDRKQNLTEVCGNMCQQHKRFTGELMRAREAGIQLVILVEHSPYIKSIDDVEKWINPRNKQWEKSLREKIGFGLDDRIEDVIAILKYRGFKVPAPPTTGGSLAKFMRTTAEKYGVRWEFCNKNQTGQRIIEILRGGL